MYIAIWEKGCVDNQEPLVQTFENAQTQKIISMIDLDDCFPKATKLLKVNDDGSLTELQMYGPWHDQNVLYIKVVNPATGEIELDGFGTDH